MEIGTVIEATKYVTIPNPCMPTVAKPIPTLASRSELSSEERLPREVLKAAGCFLYVELVIAMFLSNGVTKWTVLGIVTISILIAWAIFEFIDRSEKRLIDEVAKIFGYWFIIKLAVEMAGGLERWLGSPSAPVGSWVLAAAIAAFMLYWTIWKCKKIKIRPFPQSDPIQMGSHKSVIGMKERIEHAYTLHESGQHRTVVETLLELPTSVLEEPRTAYLLGTSLASLGRKKEACKAFERARLETPEAVYWQRCREMKTWLQFME